MTKLDINLGGGMRFAKPSHAYFDLTLPLEMNIGIVLLKACLVSSLDEMFKERENYTLYVKDQDLRTIELECPNKLNELLTKDGVVVELMKYEEEERKEDMKTEASDSQTNGNGDAFYEIHDHVSKSNKVYTPMDNCKNLCRSINEEAN